MSHTDHTPSRAERRRARRACPRRKRRHRRRRQVVYTLLAIFFGSLAALVIATRSPVATRLLVDVLEHATSTPVEADRAYVSLDGSIVVEGATFIVPGTPPGQTPGAEARFFEVKRARVWVDWRSLLGGVPLVDYVDLDRPTFRLSQSTDSGRLNVAGLAFLAPDAGIGGFSEDFHLPVLATTGGVIEIGEHGPDGYTLLKRFPVDGELVPVAMPDGRSFGFSLRQSAGELADGQRPVDLRGRYGRDGLALSLDELDLSAWSSDVVPSKVRGLYERLELEGAIGATTLHLGQGGALSVSMELEGVGVTLPFDIEGELIDAGRAPRLRNTTGKVTASTEGVRAELTGVLDELEYTVELTSTGVDRTSPFLCVLNTTARFDADQNLFFFLPDGALEPLSRFIDPRADIEAHVRVERTAPLPDGTPAPVRTRGDLTLSNGQAAYVDFPYPFKDLEGQVSFDDSTLEIVWIRGRHDNGAELSAKGRFGPLGPESEVDLEVTVAGVPIDDELRGAMSATRREMVDALFNQRRHAEAVELGLVLPPGVRAVPEADSLIVGEGASVPAFDFGGRADVDLHIRREYGLESIWTRSIGVTIPRAGLVPEHFPLPLIAEGVRLDIDERFARLGGGVIRGLQGGVARVDALVEISDADGNPIADAKPTIRILGEGVPIDQRLLSAIPGYRAGDERRAPEPGSLRWILDRLRLGGVADCVATIEPRESGRLGYTVEATFDDLASQPAPLASGDARPLDLHGLSGTIFVREDLLVVDLDGLMTSAANNAQPGDPGDRFTSPVTLFAEVDLGDPNEGTIDERELSERMAGASIHMRAGASDLDVGAPVEHAIAVFSPTLAERAGAWRREHGPAGVLDAHVELRGELGSGVYADVAFDDIERLAWGVGADRYDLARCEGTVTLITGPDPVLRAEGFRGALTLGGDPAGTVRADGILPLVRGGETPAPNAHPEARFDAAVEDARFESRFTASLAAQRLGDRLRTIYTDAQPKGVYEIHLLAMPERPLAAPAGMTPGELGLPVLDVSGSVVPRTLAFTRAGERIELTSMGGDLRFDPQNATAQSLSGRADGWRFLADAAWSARPDGSSLLEAAFDVTTDAGLPRSLRALLPSPVAGVLDDIEFDATGPVRALDVALTLDSPPETASETAHRVFDVGGAVEFEGAAAVPGVALSEGFGRMTFEASNTPDRADPDFRLDVGAERVRVMGVRTTRAHAQVMSGSTPGDILAPSIGADCHTGRIAASAQVRGQGDARRYWADASVSGVRAAPAFADLGVQPEDPPGVTGDTPATAEGIDRARREGEQAWNSDDASRGQINGSVALSGKLGDPSDRTGRADVRIARGPVVALPGLIPLIEASNLQLPVGDELDTAQMTALIDGPTVTFEQLSALSGSVEVFGFGTMDWASRALDIRFNSRALRPIPFVSDVLEGVRDELVTTRVRGTPGELEFSTEQLSGTRRLLRSLFGGASSDREQRLRDIEDRVRDGQSRSRRDAQRAEVMATMPAVAGTTYPDGAPPATEEPAEQAPTLVVQPTDDG